MFGIFDAVIDTAEKLIEDPVGESIRMAVQPVVDVCDVVDGLSEGS